LSDSEREALLGACKESTWDRLHLLVMAAITTGMRKSELINLRWNHINFDNGLASLADTKNGEPRINAIPDITLVELKKFRQIGNGLVFGGTKKIDNEIVPELIELNYLKEKSINSKTGGPNKVTQVYLDEVTEVIYDQQEYWPLLICLVLILLIGVSVNMIDQ